LSLICCFERIIDGKPFKPTTQEETNMLNMLKRITRIAAGAIMCAAVVSGAPVVLGVSPASVAVADDRQAGIQAVITRQLEAFRRNDADAAWAIAAPTIQKRFGTKGRFMEMVGNYYPQIMNSQSAIFKGLREIQGNIIQRVFIEGGPGDFVDAYYTMEMIDGVWRINAVHVTKPKAEGA